MFNKAPWMALVPPGWGAAAVQEAEICLQVIGQRGKALGSVRQLSASHRDVTEAGTTHRALPSGALTKPCSALAAQAGAGPPAGFPAFGSQGRRGSGPGPGS